MSSVRPAKSLTIAACSSRLVLMVEEAPRSPEECGNRFLFSGQRRSRHTGPYSYPRTSVQSERAPSTRMMMYHVSRSLSRAFARIETSTHLAYFYYYDIRDTWGAKDRRAIIFSSRALFLYAKRKRSR
jgi:hypothetical protein